MNPTNFSHMLHEAKQMIRFGVVGLLATATHLCVSLAMSKLFNAPDQLANFSGFAVALAVSFIGHFHFVFRVNKSYLETLPKFLIAAFTGYLSSAVVLHQLSKMDVMSSVRLSLAVIVVPLMSYIINRFWVFNSDTKS